VFLKKTNHIIALTFWLLSLNIWATEISKDSIKGFYIANPDVFYAVENTLAVNNKLVNAFTSDLTAFNSTTPPTQII
jgi:hypothetical protein